MVKSMQISRPRARMAGTDRREQLLDVARAIVHEHGFHAVTVEAVARSAGISRPVVYAHFEDLDRLLEEMVARESRRALAQLRQVLPPAGAAGDPRDLLTGALRGYLEAVRRDPVTWRLVLVPPEGAPSLLREHIASGRASVVAALAEVVGAGAGGVRTPDPDLAARLLSAAADEMARLVLADPGAYTTERLVAYARWFLDRLGHPPAAGEGGPTAPPA